MKRNRYLFIMILICAGLFMMTERNVQAARNPYSGNINTCSTYAAWQHAYEKTGVILPNWGKDGNWLSKASSSGFSTGMTPKVNSIITFRGTYNSTYNHVAFVTWVSSDKKKVHILEGAFHSKTGVRHNEADISATGARYPGLNYEQIVTGYIYLNRNTRTPVQISSGSYVIQSALGSRVLDISNSGKSAGASAQIRDKSGKNSQTFCITRYSNNCFAIQNKNSGLYLDSSGNLPGSCDAIQWNKNGVDGQCWIFENAGNGCYYIRNLYGYYLYVSGGSNTNGCNVKLWPFNGSTGQKWRLTTPSSSNRVSTPVTGTTSRTGNTPGRSTTSKKKCRNNTRRQSSQACRNRNRGRCFRIDLRWKKRPRDLDAHLRGPKRGGGRYHIFWNHKSGRASTLDYDYTKGYGWETIYVRKSVKGVYRFYVHDYTNRMKSGSRKLSKSKAKVIVTFANGSRKIISVPRRKKGNVWHVFSYNAKKNKFKVVNKFMNVKNPCRVGK